MVVFTLDRQGFDFAFHRAMQLDFDIADFRQPQATIQFEPRLRIRERVAAILRTKAGKTRYLPSLATNKEGLKGFVDAAQNILQHLAMNGSHVVSNRLDVPKLIRLRYVVDALVSRRPSIPTFLQSGVVKFSAQIQRCLQLFSLLTVRVQTIFEGQS